MLAYVDSWEQDETLYIRTELCELGNFAHFLWEYGRAFPKLDEARVWKILADLSNVRFRSACSGVYLLVSNLVFFFVSFVSSDHQGLHFIHDAGVIHLDLKPANIFVTGEGRFKIGDFGMASLWPRPNLVAAAAASPAPDGLLQLLRAEGFEREGDKVYLAPEVLQGCYGKAADIFRFVGSLLTSLRILTKWVLRLNSLGMTMLETASNIVVPGECVTSIETV